MATIDDFQKLAIKIGTIRSAEKVEGSSKLLKLDIDLGHEKRQILAGIGEKYKPEDLKGKQIPILANLDPRTMMGLESNGMILAADTSGDPVLLHPDKKVANGTTVR
jgi:methionine--tRNA ligase beta chain